MTTLFRSLRLAWVVIASALLGSTAFLTTPLKTLAGALPRFRGNSQLSGLAVDAAGNLFLSDSGTGQILKITPQGVKTVVAGIGTVGFSGDGGPATAAALNAAAVAVDGTAGLFVAGGALTGAIWSTAQPYNLRERNQNLAIGGFGVLVPGSGIVRKITPDGTITTVAGIPGRPGWSGDGGPAASASIEPYSIAVDRVGNLYIGGDYVVRKVTPAGIISTVAGRGPSSTILGYGFSGDGGPATAAQLNDSLRVAVDGAGNLFILDWANQRVRKVTPDGIIVTVAGSGPNPPPRGAANRGMSAWNVNGYVAGGFGGDGGLGTSASLRRPQGIAADAAGNVYIADTGNHRIRKLNPAGVITTVAGNGQSGTGSDSGVATFAAIDSPRFIAVDADGNLYIANSVSNIRKVTPDGIIHTLAIRTAEGPRPPSRRVAGMPLAPAVALVFLALLMGMAMRRRQ